MLQFQVVITNIQRSHWCTTLYFTSGVAGPAQRPGIHEVNLAAVSSPSAWFSAGEVMVVAMGTVATATAMAERDGPSISRPNHKPPPEDGGDGQIVHYLLSLKCLLDELRTAIGYP